MLYPGPGALLQRVLEGTLRHPVLAIKEKAPPLGRWSRGCASSIFACSLTFSSIAAFAFALALAFTLAGSGIVQLQI